MIESQSKNDVAGMVRDVTDTEVAFYEEHGWVKLDGLISQTKAAELLAAAEKLKTVVLNTPKSDDLEERQRRTSEWRSFWTDYPSGAQSFQVRKIRIEPFFSFVLSKELGRVAHRLINRVSLTDETVGVSFREDALWCKASLGVGSGDGTGYHQDYPLVGLDRVADLEIWIALDEVTPEQGAMRFLDKSHLGGPLGTGAILERYPKLTERYQWSPPLHYKPGDATVHHPLLVHGAPDNATTKPRWSYILSYMSEDAVFTNPKSEAASGMPEPNERFPHVYP